MANICNWTMKVVGKDLKSVERVYDILNNTDSEYYVCRCYGALVSQEPKKEGDLWSAIYFGDVAWSCYDWFNKDPDFYGKLIEKSYELNENGTWNFSKPIYGTSRLDIFPVICKKLDVGIEVFSQEPGVGFQAHDAVTCNGDIIIDEETKYYEEYFDDNGDELDEPIIEGGFDYYCEFMDDYKILTGKGGLI